ncbi:Uma2 family endonuclease [Lentzea alba]|uniref:Uma2 family endonuclease n=1 Tax=Lentzea alba TaxID=2714351 RepID=UPI0028BD8A68|nr:Uma2 family endonuclease [Lentzea alba]
MWESLDPLEGCRIELSDGRFVAIPVQAVKHQRAGDRFGYIPDVVVTTERIETVSVDVANVALAVEIVSPSTKKSDHLEKPAALAAAGVPAYWRVELDGAYGPVIYCHRLNDGVYSDVVTLTPGNQLGPRRSPQASSLELFQGSHLQGVLRRNNGAGRFPPSSFPACPKESRTSWAASSATAFAPPSPPPT